MDPIIKLHQIQVVDDFSLNFSSSVTKAIITAKTNLSCMPILKTGFSITYGSSALSGYFNSKNLDFRDICFNLSFSSVRNLPESFVTWPVVFSSILYTNIDYNAVQKVLSEVYCINKLI